MHASPSGSVHLRPSGESRSVDRRESRQRVRAEAGESQRHPRALQNVLRSHTEERGQHQASADRPVSVETKRRRLQQDTRRQQEIALGLFAYRLS